MMTEIDKEDLAFFGLILKISAILLNYPTFEECFFMGKKVQFFLHIVASAT